MQLLLKDKKEQYHEAAAALRMSEPTSHSGSPPPPPASSTTGASAFHPDLSCREASSYHHHHHLHHHHYHDSAYDPGASRRPTIKPSEEMDPRFAGPTCPCGGLLMRASSLQRLYASRQSSADDLLGQGPSSSTGTTPRSPFFRGKDRRRGKDGSKHKHKKHFDFSGFVHGLFRPKKVGIETR